MPASLDDLLSMAVFARVVQERSFTGAAPHLGLSKSVVSERVAALEHRLGARLLHRTTRKLSLTPEGARLYELFQRVLTAADEAADSANSISTRIEGRLRVTVPVGLGLSHIAGWIPEFCRRYPDVSLDLSMSERMEDLVSGAFDVALRVAAQLPDSGLMVRRIATVRRVVVASPAYLAAHPAPTEPKGLSAHACLQLAGTPSEWWFPKSDGGVVRVQVTGPLVADSIAVLRIATIAGLGVSVLPDGLIAADVSSGRLVALLENFPHEVLGLFIVTPHRDVVPGKVRAFVEFFASKIAAVTQAAERSERP